MVARLEVELGTLADLATKARPLDIANVTFAPPLIAPGNPNFALIRQTVAEQIATSEALDAAAKSKKPTAQTTASTATKAPSTASTAPATGKKTAFANESVATTTEDLSSVCAAR